MKNNRCESNDRKMQDHDNWKVRRWKIKDRKMEDQIWRKMEDWKMQDQLSFVSSQKAENGGPENGKMEDQIWRKMEDQKMQDQLSFICTHYTHKTVTVKKLIKTLHTKKLHTKSTNCLKNNMQTLGRPSRHSCQRQQSVQFDEAKSLTNRKTNTEIVDVSGDPPESTQVRNVVVGF